MYTVTQPTVSFHMLSNIRFNLQSIRGRSFIGRGFQERFECFAAVPDEWEYRGGAGHFFAPPPGAFSPPAHPMGGQGAATAWPMPQATLRPCLEIFQHSSLAEDKAPPHWPLSGPVLGFSSLAGDKAPPLEALMAIG